MIDRRLLDLLVCPATRAPLVPDETGTELWCLGSGLAYPVNDGIPVLLEDRARALSPAEIELLRAKKGSNLS